MNRLFLLSAIATCALSTPLVTTSLGDVQGFEYVNALGQTTEAFLNIPYAQTPQRFQKPQDPAAWSGVLDATSFGNVCPPHTRQMLTANPTSEDCLTLNIIRPNVNSSEPLPVLVWIHGGGFLVGAARDYGYKPFAEYFVPRGVIIVTLNYRVGPIGFLSAPKYGIKGNFGYWDLAKGFEFIKNHIASFGGNPNQITAWGHSAGGCASNALSISPVTRDMIYATFEMSGNAVSSWGIGGGVAKNSEELIEAAGCNNTNAAAVLSCLQGKTLDELYDAVNAVGYTTNYIDSIKWGPVIDGEFIPKHPYELSREAPAKPSVVGVADQDSAISVLMGFAGYTQNMSIPSADLPVFDKTKLMAKILYLVKPEYYGNKTSAALSIYEDMYAKCNKSIGYYLKSAVQFINAVTFAGPAIDSIKIRRHAGWKLYAYSFEQYNDVIWTSRTYLLPNETWGSIHANEYSYLFDMFILGKFNMTGADLQAREALFSALTSMAKTGKPTVPGVQWKRVGREFNFLSIKGRGQMKQDFLQKPYRFIERTRKLGFDLSTLEPTRPYHVPETL